MAYTLYGSKTSPFVRRIRMLLEDIQYEFVELNIFETEDGNRLNKINPVNQVPVLTDGERTIWDSRQIFNYLNVNHKLFNVDWDDENLLTAIEGAMNSGVALLLMKRSGMEIDGSFMYINRQKERIESVLDFFKPIIENRCLKEWDFLTMTVYTFIDWAVFRGIINIAKRPECQMLLETYKNKSIVKNTEIPKV